MSHIQDIVFKPYEYDPLVFVDSEQAVAATLSAYGVDTVDQLPLSAFRNYTADQDNLNMFSAKTGVEKYMGNSLHYLSAGDTTSTYVTGVLATPESPARNLLNVNQPTVNFIPGKTRLTQQQIGGYFLPQYISPITYANFKTQAYVLEQNLTPNTLYVYPDPSIYGNVYGNRSSRQVSPIDHKEDLSWFKAPPILIGAQGRITGTQKIPGFNSYTSTEQSLGVPPQGATRFTDNFDFWSGSVSGDVWANQDVYPLVEANRYNIPGRLSDLMTNSCDDVYKWRTDAYGNQYVMYKLSTHEPKIAAGGSDLDGDGKDDDIRSGLGHPDYYNDDGGVDPIWSELGAGGGGNFLGDGGSAGIPDGSLIIGEDGEVETPEGQGGAQFEASSDNQLPVTECKYWLDGGPNFRADDPATNLDQLVNSGLTIGEITTIIDGGYRPWNAADDRSANQIDVYPNWTPTSIPDINGFFDQARYDADGPSFDPESNDKPTWLPDWTYEEVTSIEDFRHIPQIDQRNSNDIQFTLTFDDSDNGFYDYAYRGTTGRKENQFGFRMIVADAGWRNYQSSVTFFRQRCDRASYIVALYGDGDVDFGDHIFACKLFKITGAPDEFIDNDTAITWYDTHFPQYIDPATGKNNKHLEDLLYARTRGPLDFRSLRNPLQWASNYEKNKQFLGTGEMLENESLPVKRYDYLTIYEFYLMRVSPIDGSGSRSVVSETEQETITEQYFISDKQFDPKNTGYYGEPDVFYYVNDGVMNSTSYETISSAVPWIKPAPDVSLAPPDDSKIVFDDVVGINNAGQPTLADIATQFPQVPWDTADSTQYKRDYTIPLDDVDSGPSYYGLNCNNVCEYQVFTDHFVTCEYVVVQGLTLNRTVPADHPVERFRGLTLRSKRGYFPPPVADFRRNKTHPLAADTAKVGPDAPINENFLPEDGFYVHDVWDGAGFVLRPDTLDEEGYEAPFEPPAEAAPPDPTDPSIDLPPGEDPMSKCGEFRFPGQTGWQVKPTADGAGYCKPLFGDEGGGDDGDGGTCEVCVDLPGLKIDPTCGDYKGYFIVSSNNFASPCDPSKNVPVLSVAQMVKRASDHGADTCVSPHIFDVETNRKFPTLWEQKHTSYTSSVTDDLNIFYRNVHSDKIGPVSECFDQLFDKYSDYITGTKGFIDFDIVYDILSMRQKQEDGRETIIFDQLSFNYNLNKLTTGDKNTYILQTDDNVSSQHISQFFNEYENKIVCGVTRGDESSIYPELYQLDVSSYTWKQVFPYYQLDLGAFNISDEYEIVSVDPGEMSYNKYTNHYSVTCMGTLQTTEFHSSGVGIQLPVVFNTVIYINNDIVKLVSADYYVSSIQPDLTEYDALPDEVTHKLKYSDTSTPELSASAQSFVFNLELKDLIGVNSGDPVTTNQDVLYVQIDWGDGEKTTLYSEFDSPLRKSQFQRYGLDLIGGKPGTVISKNTTLFTGDRFDETRPSQSVTNHTVRHTYRLTGGEFYKIKVTAYYHDDRTVFGQTFNLTSYPYSLPTQSTAKLLATRLYRPVNDTSNEKLLLALETQEPRYVAYNTINTTK